MTYVTTNRLQQLEARLSDRDRELLRQVDRLRLVSSEQLRRLYFVDVERRTAQRQMRRLVELGVLAHLVRRIGGVRLGSAGFIYELAVAGQRLVQSWQSAGGKARSNPEPGLRFVAHTLACAETYVGLVEAEREGRLQLLEHHAEPACWRTRVGTFGRPVSLRPDGFVRLVVGERELWWFVEVDRATESLSVIRRQGRAYLSYYQTGIEPLMPRVAWLAPSTRRAELLRGALHELGGVARELFVTGRQDDATRLLTGETS